MNASIPTRQLLFDTETTGLPPDDENQLNEHRIVDIALIEMVDFQETGRVFQEYVDPGRDIPESATRIHGITDADVRGKPMFSHIVPRLLEFLEPVEPGGSVEMVAHNAPFDMRFLRDEVERAGNVLPGHLKVVDTLSLARQRYPRDGSHSVDALIAKLKLDPSPREKFHGALVDATFLGPIYRHLTRRDELTFAEAAQVRATRKSEGAAPQSWFPRREPAYPTDEEDERHAAFAAKLKINPWASLFGTGAEEA